MDMTNVVWWPAHTGLRARIEYAYRVVRIVCPNREVELRERESAMLTQSPTGECEFFYGPLWEALQDAAPEGHFFGPRLPDMAYGYWTMNEQEPPHVVSRKSA
jgi:hypothetical protein